MGLALQSQIISLGINITKRFESAEDPFKGSAVISYFKSC